MTIDSENPILQRELESEQAMSPVDLPPYGNERITYRPVHHIQDQNNQGLAMLIDGQEVWSVDYYPYDDEESYRLPEPMDVYQSYQDSVSYRTAD